MGDPFDGSWQFDPTHSQFQFERPFVAAIFHIQVTRDVFSYRYELTTNEGEDLDVFDTHFLDGRPSAAQTADAKWSSALRIDEKTMEFVGVVDDCLVSLASQVISEDGQTMIYTATRFDHPPDGEDLSNVLLFRKIR